LAFIYPPFDLMILKNQKKHKYPVEKSDKNGSLLSLWKSVRFQQESVSGISRKQCPLCAGITVRIPQESVSVLVKNMHLIKFTKFFFELP